MAFEIVITKRAQGDLDELRAYDLRAVIQAIEHHLTHQPRQISRSRIKELGQPAISQYRLRIGDYRVYYDVHDEEQRVVVMQVHEKGRGTTPV